MPNLRFALDEDVAHDLAGLLRTEQGYDIDSAKELGRLNWTDVRVLTAAADEGRTLVTHNRKDHLLLHEAWITWQARWAAEVAAGQDAEAVLSGHAGILLLPHRSVRDLALLVQAFAEAGTPIANRLLDWSAARGWYQPATRR